MKRTRTLFTLLIISALCIIFRDFLFRQCVAYHSLGVRNNYLAQDPELLEYIAKNTSENKNGDVEEIIRSALSLTSERLQFTAADNANDPNNLIRSRKAHCVGYAAFFATCCNTLLEKHGLDKTWNAQPQIGQLYVFGENVHPYFDTPFFKDHDFVSIRNVETGERIAVDPSMYDYLYIDRIRVR